MLSRHWRSNRVAVDTSAATQRATSEQVSKLNARDDEGNVETVTSRDMYGFDAARLEVIKDLRFVVTVDKD
jgi:hypothetical protein